MTFQDIVIICAGLLTIISFGKFLWVKVIKPLAKLDDALPVLFEIAEEFKPNGGGSLHDSMQNINEKVTKLDLRIEEQKEVSNQNRDKILVKVADLEKDISAAKDVASETREEVLAKLVKHEDDDIIRFDALDKTNKEILDNQSQVKESLDIQNKSPRYKE